MRRAGDEKGARKAQGARAGGGGGRGREHNICKFDLNFPKIPIEDISTADKFTDSQCVGSQSTTAVSPFLKLDRRGMNLCHFGERARARARERERENENENEREPDAISTSTHSSWRL